MKNISRSKTPKRSASTTASPYSEKNLLDKKSQQKAEEDFLKCVDGTRSGVYLTRK